jgi:hypothetical protein
MAPVRKNSLDLVFNRNNRWITGARRDKFCTMTYRNHTEGIPALM